MTAEDIAALNDQITAMARAGLPLDQGLQSLAKEMGSGELRSVTEALAADLRAGHPLPEALARQEGRLPPYYASLVTAGIKTGRLPEVLTTLSTYAQTIALTRGTILEALIYPFIILVVAFAILGGIAWTILPEFDAIFHDFGMKLPRFTELVLTVGRNIELFVLLPTFVVVVGIIVVWATWNTPWGRRLWTHAIYLIPVVGTLIRSARLAAFTDLLGMLVEYGMPLPAAFRLAGAASSDPDMAQQAYEIEDRLGHGLPLAEAFRGRGLIPEWIAWLAAAGERQSALGPALREIAAIYRKRVQTRTTILRTVFPPLIVITIAGVLVVVFAGALFLPMIKLLEGLSN
jgi:type II secretory pathway component PulF